MEDFIRYSDYYAYASDMHRQAYQSFDGLSALILQVDNQTIEAAVPDLSGEDLAKELTNSVETTRNNILVNFSQIGYIEASFVELAKYVKTNYDFSTVDDALSDWGIQVFDSYARVSDVLADPISEANIKIQ